MSTAVVPNGQSQKIRSYPAPTWVTITTQGPNTIWIDHDPAALENPVPFQQGRPIDRNKPYDGWWEGDLYAIGSAPNTVVNVSEGTNP